MKAKAYFRADVGRRGAVAAVAPRLIVLASLLAVSLAFVPTALADSRIGTLGSGPGGLANITGVAVSKQQNGAIYVIDASSNQRVSEFEPNGTFVRGFGWSAVPPAASGTGNVVIGAKSITNVAVTNGVFLRGQVVTAPGIQPNTTVTEVNSSEVLISKPAKETGTGITITAPPAPGNVPVNEQETLAVKATGGEFRLVFRNPNPGKQFSTTATIPFNAPASGAGSVQEALENLPTIGAGNVTVTEGEGDATGSTPYVVNFVGRYADVNVRPLTSENVSLSGGSPSSGVTVTTTREGGGALETCTTVCKAEQAGEGEEEPFRQSYPGQLNWSDAIAIDNDSSSLSYGDVYVLDQRNFRIEKYSPTGQFLLMFGGEVDKTTGANVCSAADIASGDTCGAGVPGTGPSQFYKTGESIVTATSWGNEGNNSIAVGPGGTVYVGDFGRIQEFNENGGYVGSFTLPDGEARFVTGLAVDSSGDLYERSATYGGFGSPMVSQVPGVREFDSSHTLLNTYGTETGNEITHFDIDASGDVLAAVYSGGKFAFRAYKSAGTLYAVFTSEEVQPSGSTTANNPPGLAMGNATGSLYVSSPGPEGSHVAVVSVPVPGAPVVRELTVSDIRTTTATLHGVVNPKGFDTEYHFEYVDQHSFETEGGFSSPNTESTPSSDLGLVDQPDSVLAAISGLTPGTLYHWRVVAENAEGTTAVSEEFETLTAVSVRDLTTQTVGPELVTLKAELNPNGSESSWTLKLGNDTSYQTDSATGTLPIGNAFVPVSATFTHLSPNTTYHYQLVAANGYGVVETSDHVFTTERSPAELHEGEQCPNTILREENDSLALPDCRAYEQVSPVNKEGNEAALEAAAPDGDRAVFRSFGAFAGAATNPFAVQYLAQRTESGWSTRAILAQLGDRETQPGANLSYPELLNPALDRWVFTETPGLTAAEANDAKSGYFSMGFADGSYVAQATPELVASEGIRRPLTYLLGIEGESEDLSRLFIQTGSRLLRAPEDERPDEWNSSERTRIYEISNVGTPSASVQLVAEVPLGLVATYSTRCELNGDYGGRVAPLTTATGNEIIYTAPIENAPGGKCGEETSNPIGLYVKVEGHAAVQINVPPPSQCTSPAPCASGESRTPVYDGASRNGDRVWFTTAQSLVNEDTDETNDLYMAELEPDGQVRQLVLISAGEATASHPTPGSGADVGEEGVNGGEGKINQGVLGVSRNGSTIAFESGAVLTESENGLHEAAVLGANNVYTYSTATHSLSFVTELCSGPELSGTGPLGSGNGTTSTATPKNAVKDTACPPTLSNAIDPFISSLDHNDSALWLPNRRVPVVFTPDGRYMLFRSWGQLTPDDTDNVPDVFRYDTQTGELIRISLGHNGNDGNGNDNSYPVDFAYKGGPFGRSELSENEGRAVSSDGSRVIFQTNAPLVSSDTNEAEDVYMWEEAGHGTCHEPEGCVTLISDGVDPHGGHKGIISSNGNDIMFTTFRGEVPADTDGVGDVYDARVNGGFRPPVPPPPCTSPEACRPGVEATPAAPRMGTETIVTPGNQASHLKCAKGKRRVVRHGQTRCVAKHKRRGKRRHHGHRRKGHKRWVARRGGSSQGGRR